MLSNSKLFPTSQFALSQCNHDECFWIYCTMPSKKIKMWQHFENGIVRTVRVKNTSTLALFTLQT